MIQKKIVYKSVFQSEESKDIVKLEGIGNVIYDDMIRISFQDKGSVIEIRYSDEKLVLKNNESVLHFKRNKMVLNRYQMMYGEVFFKTKLLQLKYSDDFVGIKYELYDDNGLISTVYITINMISL
jgi:Domain of unknown function (DUF1934).